MIFEGVVGSSHLDAGDIAIDDFSLTADTEASCDGKNFDWRSTGTLFEKKNVATKRNLQGYDGRKKVEEMVEFCQEQHLRLHWVCLLLILTIILRERTVIQAIEQTF